MNRSLRGRKAAEIETKWNSNYEGAFTTNFNHNTTRIDGYLGSRNDEKRSESRYLRRIAEFRESSSLRTHIALRASGVCLAERPIFQPSAEMARIPAVPEHSSRVNVFSRYRASSRVGVIVCFRESPAPFGQERDKGFRPTISFRARSASRKTKSETSDERVTTRVFTHSDLRSDKATR